MIPAPTGSETVTNTIGNVWVIDCSASTLGVALARSRRRERDKFGRKSPLALRALLAPADIEADVDGLGPASLLKDFLECRETGLTFAVAG